jgi:4-amino-4-deoxychorismate lyase
MLDIEGEVVCGTSSNVFIVRGGELVTPDLRFSGVRGVMRGQVLRIAGTLGIPCHEEPLYPQDFDTASEVFVTNAVRGIRSVVQLGEQHWSPGPITTALRDALNAHA